LGLFFGIFVVKNLPVFYFTTPNIYVKWSYVLQIT